MHRMPHAAAKDVRQGAACLALVTRKAVGRIPCGAKAARGALIDAAAASAALRPICRPGCARAAARGPKHGAAVGGQSMPGEGRTPGKVSRLFARGTRSLKGRDAGSGAVRMV